MNNIKIITLLVVLSFFSVVLVKAQPLGYYNGTENLSGESLKSALHEKIKNHVDFSYNRTRDIINYADADPDNPDNVILFYLQQSRNSDLYGLDGDFINREHVWAKSHGLFTDIRPMYTDVHNLRPADASVNEDRSNKDFDNVQPNGIQDQEATQCWYTETAWEPGPLTKGQVARTIFYMATRYEGDNNEMDLEVVDKLNTYPLPEHGKLSTLLEWNDQYPPSDFERRRNERIFQIQQNRNPFIDHPEFIDLIWKSKTPDRIQFSDLSSSPENPNVGETANISLKILSAAEPESVSLFWGTTFDSKQNKNTLTKNADLWSTNITLNNVNPGETVYYLFNVVSENDTFSYRGSYVVPEKITSNELTTIPAVQGQGTASPMLNNKVTISGRVTAVFDNSFYIQDNSLKRGGINIYNTLQTGNIGDSIIVRGTVAEYATLTELSQIEYLYNYRNKKEIAPITINTLQINEDYEGMLVKIENVAFTNGGTTVPEANTSFTFSDEFGSSVLFSSYNSRLVGKPLPRGRTTIVGIVSEYNGAYQILARDMTDLTVTSKTEDIFIQKNPVLIYPNPASGIVHILSYTEIKSVSVFNLNGVQLFREEGNISTFDVSGLPSGLYITKIESAGEKIYINKFSKQ